MRHDPASDDPLFAAPRDAAGRPPHGDFAGEDYAEPGTLPVSPDFVARTAKRIRDDLARIRAEAALVDGAPLPRALLEAFAAPRPSSDFVARTLDAMALDAQAAPADDAALDALLERYVPPRISSDFVTRTLDALREPAAATRLHLVRAPATSTAAPRWRRRLVAAAAILALAIGLRAMLRDGDGDLSRPDPRADSIASTFVFSPSVPTTAFARLTAARAAGAVDELEFQPLDGLLLLAAGEAP